MKPEKHNSCDTSSEEISDQSKNVYDENPNPTVASRSYDCAFCKRGFTNAQALGGHMNIHRKDKSKNKKKDLEEPSMKSGLYFPAVSSNDHQKQSTICYTAMGAELRFQVYLPSPNTNPRFLTHEIHNLGSPNPNILSSAWRPQCLITSHDDHLDASLSLGIGPSVVEDEGGKENEVDLELRLGQPTRDHSESAHKIRRETVYME